MTPKTNDLGRGLDLLALLDQAEKANSIDYRDPFPLAGETNLATRTQDHAWRFLLARKGDGPRIAMIGAKGSGKTHFGSAFAFHMGQIWPESMGCVISNTYTQAKDNAGALIMKMAQQLGYHAQFFQTKTVRGRPYTSLFVVDLDGAGCDAGKNFYVLVRSFEAVNKLEGIELDWLWCEEIQDAQEKDFNVVLTRVRGQNADNSVFVAGMPEDEIHWMYKRLPKIGAIEEDKIRNKLGTTLFDVRLFEDEKRVPVEPDVRLYAAGTRGVLLEPSIFENRHHLPVNYIDDMKATLDSERAEQWIYGRRTSQAGNRVAHAFNAQVHKNGRMSQVLCHYDPALPLLFAIDFNVAPMSCTVWQEKGWSDVWDDDEVMFDAQERLVYRTKEIRDPKDESVVGFETVPMSGFTELAPPDRKVLAQVDEFEVWEGGTRGLMREVIAKYGPSGVDHQAGVRVMGDSTGDRRDTRSETTDWQIIQNEMSALPNCAVQPGVEVTSNYKTGKVSYKNPERRDTFNVLNAALRDANGQVWVCFLPTSPLPSQGAAAAVQAMRYKPDGTFDVPRPKDDNREAIRDHLFDTVRYAVWDFRGGLMTPDAWADSAHGWEESTTLSNDDWGSPGTFGTGWDGVWT